MKPYLAIVACCMGLLSNTAWAKDRRYADVAALAAAFQEYMAATYSCQSFLGGTAQYRVAKQLATDTYTKLSGDRNEAVLQINEMEQQIKAAKLKERMEAGFKQLNLEEVDAVKTCQDAVADSLDKVDVMRAKLRLL